MTIDFPFTSDKGAASTCLDFYYPTISLDSFHEDHAHHSSRKLVMLSGDHIRRPSEVVSRVEQRMGLTSKVEPHVSPGRSFAHRPNVDAAVELYTVRSTFGLKETQ